MAAISAKDVKALRDATGAGMMDCKKALSEAEGDVEKAMEILRASGLAKAGKRAGRETSEGAVMFSAQGGNGALIELGCETDFVAKTDDFQALAQSVADAVAGAGAVADVDAALAVSMDGGSIDDVIKATVGKVGENIQLKRVATANVAGATGGYIHGGGKLAVLVALETKQSGDAVDAVAKEVAMHVAAHDPTPIAVDRDDMPADAVEKERAFLGTGVFVRYRGHCCVLTNAHVLRSRDDAPHFAVRFDYSGSERNQAVVRLDPQTLWHSRPRNPASRTTSSRRWSTGASTSSSRRTRCSPRASSRIPTRACVIS